jgi:general secretion pathway protein A
MSTSTYIHVPIGVAIVLGLGLALPVLASAGYTPEVEAMKASVTAVLEAANNGTLQVEVSRSDNGKKSVSTRTVDIRPVSLDPEIFWKKMVKKFSKTPWDGASPISLKEAMTKSSPADKAHMLAELLNTGRGAIAKKQMILNAEGYKSFIPAIFGRAVATEFAKRTGIQMKQTSVGKNGYGARNPKNAPDAWETKVLTGWNQSPPAAGYGTSDGGHRYLYPLRIVQPCLPCHGDPVGERDVFDIHTKEGYKKGDLRGGISVTLAESVAGR